METLSMQGIADLARVKRPVVSVWRRRHAATSAHPFPEPTSGDPLRFDAVQVAEWLASTGRGNNSDASLESSLYSTAFQRIATDLDAASALLLLHHLLGERVTGFDPDVAAEHVDAHQLTPILDVEMLRSALGDEHLCATVDEIAEAAFSGARALDRLVDGFTSADGPWAPEALTASAAELLGNTVAELCRASPRMVVPAGPGGLVLTSALPHQLREHERPQLAPHPALLSSAANRAAWRRLAAHGFPVIPLEVDPKLADERQGRLHLLAWQSTRSSGDLGDQIEQALLELADDDLLMVVGAAQLLVDREGRLGRARLLAPSKNHVAPLRYAALLPQGLSRFGGRRRLALWVFGRPEFRWTVLGDHSAVHLDSALGSAVAADVVASVSAAADIRAHAFRSSTVRETQRLVRQHELVATAGPSGLAPAGGERLARIWALRDDLAASPSIGNPLEGFDLASRTASSPGPVTLAQATPRLARDLAGARIPDEHIGVLASGYAPVLGPGEIRNPVTIGRRGIDRLTLEAVAPRARLTLPGDVAYVAAGGAAAIVDEHGGHLVLAPARIMRCRTDAPGDRRLVASVVAADIAAQSGTVRRTWRLRTVGAEQRDELSALTARVADHRRRLLHQLRTLDDLERELFGGLTDGTLDASVLASLQSSPTKAAR